MRDFLFKDNDIKKGVALFVALCAVAIKLFCSYTQYATVYPPLAPIDDDLMTQAASSMVAGGGTGWVNITSLPCLNTAFLPFIWHLCMS